MDLEKAEKEMDKFFRTHSQKDLLKSLYEEPLERMKKYNRKLWEEVIDKQLEFDDEDTWYSRDPNIKKYNNLWFCFNPYVDEKLPWRNCENADFPTRFLLLEDNGKQMVTTLMIGQGAVRDVVTVEGFKSWMERNKWNYKLQEKATTLDEIEQVLNETIKGMEEDIENASDEKESE